METYPINGKPVAKQDLAAQSIKGNMMLVLSYIGTLLSNSSKKNKRKPPVGYCPNCWGNQKYDNQIRTMYKDQQIDVNNHQAKHAFIQDFVITHLDGIRLKKGNNSFECPTCKTKYSNL